MRPSLGVTVLSSLLCLNGMVSADYNSICPAYNGQVYQIDGIDYTVHCQKTLALPSSVLKQLLPSCSIDDCGRACASNNATCGLVVWGSSGCFRSLDARHAQVSTDAQAVVLVPDFAPAPLEPKLADLADPEGNQCNRNNNNKIITIQGVQYRIHWNKRAVNDNHIPTRSLPSVRASDIRDCLSKCNTLVYNDNRLGETNRYACRYVQFQTDGRCTVVSSAQPIPYTLGQVPPGGVETCVVVPEF
ncbi:hypothetical protein BDV25DRAFT_138172 [Aspergillus avenaceus]|uniref:Apple domain-containing protein n=1 Tax=Aspergillus avenaceus TaxID=36643 RepID=A0A5N6U0K2_ASPAV|nr:hypothetical protein BDV25DRAFT_138172 [Aspergillus avenaceus]